MILEKSIVVKVQISQAGSPAVLIYSEGKKYIGQFTYTEDLREELHRVMGDRVKAYLYADVIQEGNQLNFDLHDIAPSQDW